MIDYDWTTAMRVRLETERDALRAQLEAVTRERDGYHEALEVANAAAKTNAEERDEARADAARQREALEHINAVVVWSDTSREWHLMPRLRTMPALEKVRAALASTPSAEPTPRDMRVAEAVVDALYAEVDGGMSRCTVDEMRGERLRAVVAKAVKP